MVDLAEIVFRDYTTDGVPGSGSWDPPKADVRAWGAWLEGFANASGTNGNLIFGTLASLNASLDYPALTSAWVIADPVVGNNGVYRKIGASGTGSWEAVMGLPYSFIKLSDAGAGTANAIIATSSIPLPASPFVALLTLNIFEANTGPATLAVNGAAPKPLVTSSGNALVAGNLRSGMGLIVVDDGTSFRIMQDFDLQVVRLTDSGAGTENAIQAAASSPFSTGAYSAILLLNVFEANTGAATLSIDGGIARSIVTNSGNPLASGYLTAGMVATIVFDGTNYRLLSDVASAAIQAAAEAAAVTAEAARDVALGAVPNVFPPTRTALKALDTGTHNHAWFDESQWNTVPYAGVSSLVAADPTEGIYIRSTFDPMLVWVRQGDWFERGILVEWFGAIGDYDYTLDAGTNNTSAFQAASAVAAAVGCNIKSGPGYFLIADKFTVPNASKFSGAHRNNTKIVANSTFNLLATSIVELGTSGQRGAEIEDVGIDCIQPDTTIRANLIAYPEAIDAQNKPRLRIRRVRIAGAMTGLDARSNSGGLIVEDLEIACFDYHIRLDTALDSVRLDKVQTWPYGVGELSTMSANHRLIWNDAVTVGWEINNVADLECTSSLILGLANPIILDGSGGFGNFSDLKLDVVRGPVTVSNGKWQFIAPHVSIASGSTISAFYQNGGQLIVTAPHGSFGVTGTTIPIFHSTAGTFVCTGGRVNTGAVNISAFLMEGTTEFNITGVHLEKQTNITYTRAGILIEGSASGVLTGNSISAKGTGAGLFISILNTTGTVLGVETNFANGAWTISPPKAAKRQYSGYFSADATTTVLLPSGWSVLKNSTGNYTVTHNLSLTVKQDFIVVPVPDAAATDSAATIDYTSSTLNDFRIRTKTAGVAADLPVSFVMMRRE